MDQRRKQLRLAILIAAVSLASPAVWADAVTDWNAVGCDLILEGRVGPSPGHRALAIMHTAVYEAANAITRRYPASGSSAVAPSGASADAAIAAAARATLVKTMPPAQAAAIESAYQAALAKIADGDGKKAGIATGEQAAASVLGRRLDDGAAAPDSYRPVTAPGVYVPTSMLAGTSWGQRKPWLMDSPTQFRPSPPPALTSALWARDYNEIKAVGGRDSTQRTAEQTAIARFWEATQPPIYYGIVRSVGTQPGRELTRNARAFAAVAQAIDDAGIAVFEAKYHYHFWRPVTAIRNGDQDGNDATERDARWTPLIDTPPHPEYPCAHCITAAAIGTVLAADLGAEATPLMTTTSVTAPGVRRQWSRVEDFIAEVSLARIYDGVHFRNSTEVGTAMGRQVGTLAARRLFGNN